MRPGWEELFSALFSSGLKGCSALLVTVGIKGISGIGDK